MDFVTLRNLQIERIKKTLQKEPKKLKIILTSGNGKKYLKLKRKPHKITIIGPKRVTLKRSRFTKNKIKSRFTTKNKNKSKRSIQKSKKQ
jgi:predicted MPP superfamily phosphohydrolase